MLRVRDNRCARGAISSAKTSSQQETVRQRVCMFVCKNGHVADYNRRYLRLIGYFPRNPTPDRACSPARILRSTWSGHVAELGNVYARLSEDLAMHVDEIHAEYPDSLVLADITSRAYDMKKVIFWQSGIWLQYANLIYCLAVYYYFIWCIGTN